MFLNTQNILLPESNRLLTSITEELAEDMLHRSWTSMEDSQMLNSFLDLLISGIEYSNSDTTHAKVLGGGERRELGKT